MESSSEQTCRIFGAFLDVEHWTVLGHVLMVFSGVWIAPLTEFFDFDVDMRKKMNLAQLHHAFEN